MRALRVALASGLGLALLVSTAAAQEAGDTGTVAGRVVVCRSALRPTAVETSAAGNESLRLVRTDDGASADASVSDKLTPVDAEVPDGQAEPAADNAAPHRPVDLTTPLQPRSRVVPRLLAVPVANALITVPGTDLSATTDATGRFEIGGVPAATPVA